ncbi:MAG: T9SS type A sorting domain-containing protein [Bacteroidales bacterium]|nr:T9SS type A sorting domain-containing protein [Bacteroidales bacterium]
MRFLVICAVLFLGNMYAHAATVKLSYLADNSGFIVARADFEVAPDLSETYGYADAFSGEKVSALDAIVAAHIAVFGDNPDDIHSALAVSESGLISNFMGDESGNFVYVVNGTLAEVAASETELNNNDIVELFGIQDPSYLDSQAWFVYDGQRTEAITVTAGEEFELTVAGIEYVIWGMDYGATPTDAIEYAAVAPVTVESGAGFFGSPLGVTGSNGKVTLKFDNAGTYILSAYDNEDYIPLMSPWLVVMVNQMTGTENVENSSIVVYPNPFAEYIIINTATAGAATIFDLSGKAVLNVNLTAGSNRINTAVLPKGVHLLKTGDNTVKIVK